MKHLHISDQLSLPLDFIVSRTCIYGDSGSGKTTFARLVAEKVHQAGQRFGAIDLKNDWWGLKSSADGSSAGIPIVIFGGPKADVKLPEDPTAAAALADTVAAIDQSFVIDLDAMSRMKQERILAALLDRFYEANRRPLLLICDEADRYAPQKPMTQEAIMSLSSSEDIARRGRKRGIGSLWLTQRTAVLNKNVSEIANNLVVVFRTPGSKDLAELEDRVGRICPKETVREVMRLAPGLPDGAAFFLSSHPKIRPFLPDPPVPLQMPLPTTFDSSATPGVGQRRREPTVLAKADLQAIELRMAAQVERARADDPKELRKQIADLKRLTARPADLPKSETRTVEKHVLKDGQLARAELIVVRLEELSTKNADALMAAKAIAGHIAEAIASTRSPAINDGAAVQRPAAIARHTPAPANAAVAEPETPGESRADGEVSKNQRAILDTILMLEVRVIPATRDCVARWLDLHPRGGNYGTNLAELRAGGYIDGLKLTDAGRSTAKKTGTGFDAAILTLAEWPTRQKILRTIKDQPAMSREDLAQVLELHPRGGNFGTDLARLRTMGLIPVRGKISATEALYR